MFLCFKRKWTQFSVYLHTIWTTVSLKIYEMSSSATDTKRNIQVERHVENQRDKMGKDMWSRSKCTATIYQDRKTDGTASGKVRLQSSVQQQQSGQQTSLHRKLHNSGCGVLQFRHGQCATRYRETRLILILSTVTTSLEVSRRRSSCKVPETFDGEPG